MKQFRHAIILTTGLCAATWALAHEGVQDAQVMARMMGMSEIQKATKVLGEMDRQKTPFDATAASAAAATIAAEAARIEALFTPQATDPKSEALPAIWTDFDDFTAIADALEQAAAAAAPITTPADLRAAMAQIGGTCRDCHRSYRE